MLSIREERGWFKNLPRSSLLCPNPEEVGRIATSVCGRLWGKPGCVSPSLSKGAHARAVRRRTHSLSSGSAAAQSLGQVSQELCRQLGPRHPAHEGLAGSGIDAGDVLVHQDAALGEAAAGSRHLQVTLHQGLGFRGEDVAAPWTVDPRRLLEDGDLAGFLPRVVVHGHHVGRAHHAAADHLSAGDDHLQVALRGVVSRDVGELPGGHVPGDSRGVGALVGQQAVQQVQSVGVGDRAAGDDLVVGGAGFVLDGLGLVDDHGHVLRRCRGGGRDGHREGDQGDQQDQDGNGTVFAREHRKPPLKERSHG